jgi:PAS domain S-box-containing protein
MAERRHETDEAAGRVPDVSVLGPDQFRTLWETVGDAMALSDPQGTVLMANPAYLELHGFSEAEVVGHNFAIIFPEDQRAWANEQYQAAFYGQETPGAFETTVQRKDGSKRTVEARVGFVTDAAGRRTAMLNVVRDITERKHAEEQARIAEGELRALLEASPRGVLMVGADLVVSAVNARVGELFGLDVSDWVGRDKRDIVNELKQRVADPEAFERRLLYLYAPEHIEEYATDDIELLRPVHRWLVRDSRPVYSADARLLGRLSGYTDVTEQRQAAAERERLLADEQRARAQAEAALRARDEFLGTISHDLQNPLTAIRGSAQLLRRRAERGGDPQAVLELAESIEATAEQMGNQVQDLVDLTKLRAGESLSLVREPMDLAALVRVVLKAFARQLARHEVQMEGDDTLPGVWDPARVRRVIANLLTNASKYSPDDTPIAVRVHAEDGPTGREAVLEVQDQGIGIPAADLPRLFERYMRGSNVEGSIAGTGLGLASARHIVELHGGRIEVATEEGRGSTFTVRLPM